MPEPVSQHEDSHADPLKPGAKSRWLKIRNWLIRIVVIVVVSTVVEKIVEHVSDHSLTHVSKSFVDGVAKVNPWGLAGLFYGYLLQGAPREPPPTLYRFQIPRTEPLESVGFGTVLLRIIPGAFYTAKKIASEGLVSTLTALVALFVGFAWMRADLSETEALSGKLLILLAVPLIGCVFVWVLLTIMWLAGLLFGWLLASAQAVAYFGVAGTCIKAVMKEKEHHVTGKLIARLTGHH